MNARAQSRSPGALNVHLHPKQWVAFLTRATEVLYGGAAGGGKSHLMRIAAIVWCSAVPGLQVYLFRRVRDDLIKSHMEGPKGFRSILAGWKNSGWCDIVEDEIRFWNGSKIYLCHCKDEKDVYKYQGAEIHVLLIDELTHFTESMYRFLRNRVRMVGIVVPAEYAGRFPRILCGANPGNIGHLWVKTTFILGAPPLKVRLMAANDGGMLRQYIPARLDDNPSMTEDDPGYEGRLEGLGSKTLVAAMRWGDWDVIEGAFFDCWQNHKHVIAPFSVPLDWLRFRSGDWGSASPASIGWWAVVQDDFQLPGSTNLSGRLSVFRGKSVDATANGNASLAPGGNQPATSTLPRGAIVRYREDYIASGPNKGLKLTAEQVADRVIEREAKDPKLAYGVLDPSAFKEDGGPSIAERINGKLVKARLAAFRAADNARVTQIGSRDRGGPMGGWDTVRARMIGAGTAADPEPMIFWFSTCLDSIRTIPTLQHDKDRAEDLDTTSEDHCFVGETLVATPSGHMRLDALPECGVVWDASGRLAAYRGARLTRRNMPVMRLGFDDGSEVTCTADHRFIVADGRWVLARNMLNEISYARMMPEWMSRSSSTIQFRNLGARTILGVAHIFRQKDSGSIALFGKPLTDQFRAVLTSIIRIAIPATIGPEISNASNPRIISPIMDAYAPGHPRHRSLNTRGRALQNGMPLIKVESGISFNTSGFVGKRSAGRLIAFANIVLKALLANCVRPASVLMPASPHRGENRKPITYFAHVVYAVRNSVQIAIRKWLLVLVNAGALPHREQGPVCRSLSDAGKADVFCLTVPDSGTFLLANGIAVSNCADDMRYAAMSRPWIKTPLKPDVPKDGYRTASEEIPDSNFKTM